MVKPLTTKIKIIISKATETRDSRMLVDIVLQDVAMQISKDQYITFLRLYDSLHRATVSRLVSVNFQLNFFLNILSSVKFLLYNVRQI